MITSPEYTIKTQLKDPIKTTNLNEIIRNTTTINVNYTYFQNVITNKQIHVRSNSQLLTDTTQYNIKQETTLKPN